MLPVVVITPAGPLHVKELVPDAGEVGEVPSVRVSIVDPKHIEGDDGVIAASVG